MVPFINLKEAKADFDVHVVDFSSGEHLKPTYLKINPKHKVPTLLLDGEPLTENTAINTWIAKTYPEAKLFPSSFKQEMEAIALMSWFASSLHPALTPNMIPKRFCDFPGSEESVKECAQKSLGEAFTLANDMLNGRQWFFDHYTVVDAYFFWTFLRATRFELKYLDLGKFPACQAHMKRMRERESVKQLFAFEKKALEDLGRPIPQ